MERDRAAKANDPRLHEVLDIVASKQQAGGMWNVEGFYWKPKHYRSLERWTGMPRPKRDDHA